MLQQRQGGAVQTSITQGVVSGHISLKSKIAHSVRLALFLLILRDTVQTNKSGSSPRKFVSPVLINILFVGTRKFRNLIFSSQKTEKYGSYHKPVSLASLLRMQTWRVIDCVTRWP